MAFRRRPVRPLPPEEQPTTVIREEGPVAPSPPPPPPPGPPLEPDRPWWPWLVVALVVVAVIAGLSAYFATRGSEKKVVVPHVVGLPEPAARNKLHESGLDQVKANHEFSPKARGIVVAQTPGGGTQAGTKDLVSLTVSKGPHAVAVPNTISLTEAEAVAQLTRAGLKADVVQVPSSQKVGTVVAQSPRPGTNVDPGSTVRLNVSKGKTQTTTVTTTTHTTTTHTTATTTTRTTTTQSTTTTGQTTTSAAPVNVPDVVGSTLSDAVAHMTSAGLLADSYPVASSDPGGTVVGQTPDAGTSAAKGSIVRLNVSTGTDRPSITVPDVTGAAQATARRTLSKTFTVRTVFRSGQQPGIVVGQLPDGGAQAKRWAQVIIYVGR
jgi:beta-lactam-binding protein with PASTA domain